MSETATSYNSLSDIVLAELVKNGDELAFNELSVRYIDTIGCIARKFSAEGYEQNDFIQEGLLGLLQSCKTFKVDCETSFRFYMSIVIKRRFISIIRSSNTGRKIPRASLIPIDDIDEAIEDSTQSPEEQFILKEHFKQIDNQLQLILSSSEYNVLMLYGSGLSYRQISLKLAVSEKSVDNALQRARNKINSHNVSS
jgi:RNA polymerase sporulation-specific sigma factor